jgi:hypothetical protein
MHASLVTTKTVQLWDQSWPVLHKLLVSDILEAFPDCFNMITKCLHVF